MTVFCIMDKEQKYYIPLLFFLYLWYHITLREETNGMHIKYKNIDC